MSDINVILRVNIIEAQNLAAKDRNGFSDPYITMNIGDATDQTHVVNKSLNPKWDAIFDHKINPENPPKEIHFTCWDKDIFGRDYMGEILISLEKLWEHNAHLAFDDNFNLPQWYSLTTTRKNEDISGQVLIKIGLIDKDNKFLDAREWNSIWRKLNNLNINDEQSAPSSDSQSTTSTVKPLHERHSSFSTLSEVVGVVFLEVVCAIDLPEEKNMTGLGFDMDPFVIISFAKNTFRTKIINHNLNPEWHEKIHFPVKKQECDFQIKFSIYDWDKFSQNDYVASHDYPIRPLIDRGIASMTKGQDFRDMENGLLEEVLTLQIHSKEKLAKKHNSKLVIKTKFIPYEQLRRQFWYSLAKYYDSDENNLLNYVELETMLSSLGSTLSQKTIDSFFTRFGKEPKRHALKFDEVISCLEQYLGDASFSHQSATPDGEEADNEHLIYLQTCPICNRPNLDQLSETNIITHVAMCASSDWGNVDKFVTGDFVTESQAQRKWLAKVITKVGFGGYKIGANNANIIIQDRKTGQLAEEKMATYVRLGIRLLYRGIGNVESAKTKNLLESMSIKQGKKFTNPSSVGDIKPFIRFHKLKIDEIADPLDSFKNFNEFFYRKLKPSARPCDSPKDPYILVSPADCRMSAFSTVTGATEVWIKGQNFSVARLLGDEVVAKEFEGGSLGIFRLAPQDYHRFHFPVEGQVGPVKNIPGAFYTVNPMAIRSTLDVYGENKRAVCYINSSQFGKVAYVAIGAMMVGSIVFTSTPNTYVRRTDEHGYFAFGGSTIILLFQKGRMLWDEDLLENSKTCLETLVYMGMHVGKAIRN